MGAPVARFQSEAVRPLGKPHRKEILKRIDDLQNAVGAIMWIGGGALSVLFLRVFFGVVG
jgi:hypothetical protein